MAGKALFGDPKVAALFRTRTRVDLAGQNKTVVVFCSVPYAVSDRYSSVQSDILEAVTRRLKREGIQVVDSNKVLNWLDDHNGVWNDPDEVAQAFEADYIIHIDLDEFTHRAENSPNMYQGRANGTVHAYEIQEVRDVKIATSVFSEPYRSVYPPHHPKPRSQASGKMFLRQYVAQISEELAQMFYDHRPGANIF